jgi:hypothetical protein
MDVRVLLANNFPIGEQIARDIAAALNVDANEVVKWAHLPLRRFYSEAVCGGALLRLGGGASEQATHVPMAFQSALAGTLLGATIAADAVGLGVPRETKTIVDLLRPTPSVAVVPIGRDGTGRCICSDPDFVSHVATR